jgi:hypothetical protein
LSEQSTLISAVPTLQNALALLAVRMAATSMDAPSIVLAAAPLDASPFSNDGIEPPLIAAKHNGSPTSQQTLGYRGNPRGSPKNRWLVAAVAHLCLLVKLSTV